MRVHSKSVVNEDGTFGQIDEPFSTEEEAARDAEEAAAAAAAPYDAIKGQIAEKEATITVRRIRESLLTDSGRLWLTNVDAQIAALRAQLVP